MNRFAPRAVAWSVTVVALLASLIAPEHATARTIHAPIALGAYIHDVPNNVHFPPNPNAIGRYASQVGRTPAIINWFQQWADPSAEFPALTAWEVYRSGAIPMITWMPGNNSRKDSRFKVLKIVRGNYDAYIKRWATAAATFGRPLLLRFGHEMNGDWYPWGAQPGNFNHNSPANFVAAWRRVHRIFADAGATNVIWVWEPAAINTGADPNYAAYYPGNAYVDWIALDGYNRGVTNTGKANWQDFQKVFSQSYVRLAKVAPKPVMLTEVGCAERGGNKAAWLTQGFLYDIPNFYPRVRAIIYFNSLRERDWRVDSSPATLRAWRHIVASPLYTGTVSDILAATQTAARPTATPTATDSTP